MERLYKMTTKFILRSALLFWVFINLSYAETLVENTTIPVGDHSYSEDLIVPADVTLTIEAGAVLRFSANNALIVLEGGKLDVKGNASSIVTFTSDAMTAGSWSGIRFEGARADDNELVIDHAIIEYADKALFTDKHSVKVKVTNSIVRHNNYGVYVDAGTYAAPMHPYITFKGGALYDNAQYNYFTNRFYGNTVTTIDATGNWWGTAEPQTIAATIYDIADSSRRASVDFTQFLTSENGNPLPGTHLMGVVEGENRWQFSDGLVISDVTIKSGASVIVEAGAKLEFLDSASLVVEEGAKLSVIGEANNPVIFTSGSSEESFGDWGGINVKANNNVHISNAVIEYAEKGIYFEGMKASGTVTNSVIRNNNYGIYVHGASQPLSNHPTPVVTNNVIQNNHSYNYFTQTFGSASSRTLNARGNYWGTNDPQTIAAKVFDHADASQSPIVDVSFARSSETTNVTANAGNDITTFASQNTTLAGTASSNTKVVAHNWQQYLGEEMTLSNANTNAASFIAPETDSEKLLSFIYRITDENQISASDRLNVIVKKLSDLGATIYEDGTKFENWIVVDAEPPGATVRSIVDELTNNAVLEISGNGYDNGYRLYDDGVTNWDNSTQFYLQWSMRSQEKFGIYLLVETLDGLRYLEYTQANKDTLLHWETYVHHGLGKGAIDNAWHTYARDLQADLKKAEPDNEIISVKHLTARGNVRFDNIMLRDELPADIDSDNDGVSNQDELAQGTNPYVSNRMDAVDVVYEDGSGVNNWRVDDSSPEGATINTVYDELLSQNVIELSGAGTSNAYKLLDSNQDAWDNPLQMVLRWSLRFTEDYRLFVLVDTDEGLRYLEYSNANKDLLNYDSIYIHYGLGNGSIDGNWHTFDRDLAADLKAVEPDNNIIEVKTLIVRGSGRLANISLGQHLSSTIDSDNDGVANQTELTEGTNPYISNNPQPDSIYENGENATHWVVSDASVEGATIESVYDDELQKNVTEFVDSGTQNAFSLYQQNQTTWNNPAQPYVQWTQKFAADFRLFFMIDTQNGLRSLEYTNSDSNRGNYNSIYIHNGLGKTSADGQWQTFARNLAADLKEIEPANQFIDVKYMVVRGSGRISEVKLLSEMPSNVKSKNLKASPAGTYYFHNDHLGTPQVMTNSASEVVWQADYTPFGQAEIKVEEVVNNIRFPGQYYDQESGLHYNYFRDYDPELGRYIQSDPIGLAGGINTYGYVDANPINFYDPYGLAKSGQMVKVPGTNTTVRIDNPHVPGQQKHAHIYTKGKPTTVINKDGTGSHGTDVKKVTKNKKVLEYLRKKGFKLGVYGILPFYTPKEAFCIVSPRSCTKQPECV